MKGFSDDATKKYSVPPSVSGGLPWLLRHWQRVALALGNGLLRQNQRSVKHGRRRPLHRLLDLVDDPIPVADGLHRHRTARAVGRQKRPNPAAAVLGSGRVRKDRVPVDRQRPARRPDHLGSDRRLRGQRPASEPDGQRRLDDAAAAEPCVPQDSTRQPAGRVHAPAASDLQRRRRGHPPGRRRRFLLHHRERPLLGQPRDAAESRVGDDRDALPEIELRLFHAAPLLATVRNLEAPLWPPVR